MLSDDFVGGIALEALCASIPICDDPARIEHVNRVVKHPFNEDSEPPLGFDNGLLCLHVFSDVARNLGEPDQRPLVVADRLYDGVGPEAGAILSDAPALSLMPTMGSSGLQYSLGKAAYSIFRGKEPGKCWPTISIAW